MWPYEDKLEEYIIRCWCAWYARARAANDNVTMHAELPSPPNSAARTP